MISDYIGAPVQRQRQQYLELKLISYIITYYTRIKTYDEKSWLSTIRTRTATESD